MSRIACIGHRGAAGHEPENTLRSFRRAIELGVDFIETDLQQTADGAIVLMHDKRIDRTTNGTGYVCAQTLAELRRVDAGKGERVPTLTELLELAQGHVGLMLEIITPGIGVFTHRMVCEYGFDRPVIYASFHHAELLTIRSAEAEVSTLALIEGVPVDGARFVKDARATHAGLALDSLTEEFVGSLRAHGTSVFAYTANDPRDIAMLKNLPVDGVISDYPERV